MTEQTEIITINEVNPEMVYQQDRAAIDTQIATAKAYPRNIKKSLENAIAIVGIDQETASTCTYSLPRGGRPITGPSVHLAKILAQTWGNLRVEAKVVAIDAKQITSQAVAFDLENNLAIKVEVKRSIMSRSGRFNDDMITVTGNAANAIALRNAVLSVIPRQIVDKVYKAAQNVITGDISDETKLIAKRKAVFDGLRETYALKEEEILGAIGKAAISHVTADDIVVLIGIGQAIKDGDTTVTDAFKKKQVGGPTISDEEKELQRVSALIDKAKDMKALLPLLEHCKTDATKKKFADKKRDIVIAEIESAKDVAALKKVIDHCDNQELLELYQTKKLNLENKK